MPASNNGVMSLPYSVPESNWLYGPDFDVFCYFHDPVLNEPGAAAKHVILRVLGIEGPWENSEDVGHVDLARIDWTEPHCYYGLWRLPTTPAVGIKVIPDIRKAGHELLLAIPPGEVNRHWGPYPWVRPNWVTAQVIQFHREVIDKCRALNSVCRLRAVMLQEEGWTFSVPPDASGLFLHPDIAAAIGLEGKMQGRMFATAL